MQRKPSRPKSANVGGTTRGSRGKQRPKSATLPRSDTKIPKAESSSQTSQSLFESVLENGSHNDTSNKGSRDEGGDRQASGQLNESKADYNRWVRSSHSGRKKRKNRKRTERNSTGELPPHNHTDNELISKLAKRRIDIILANKKSVDTGLNRRPATASMKSKSKSTGSDSTHRKWKLRDDNIIQPAVTFAPSKKGSSSSRSSSRSDEERPKFSYRKKSPAGPRHERNPVVREAVDR